MLNIGSIHQIIADNRNDPETLDFIKEIFDSFEQYHRSVYEDQLFGVLYQGAMEGDAFRERRTELDKTRTVYHNNLLANVRVLNKLAALSDVPPVYDGEVSEERPYRRQVANAVFEFIENVINNRP